MKNFAWNNEKNQKLKYERGISFEVILFYIEKGPLLDVIINPNQKKYRDQKIFIVEVNEYAFLVPFSESDDEIFLHTIIPSRKMTDKYIRKIK